MYVFREMPYKAQPLRHNQAQMPEDRVKLGAGVLAFDALPLHVNAFLIFVFGV